MLTKSNRIIVVCVELILGGLVATGYCDKDSKHAYIPPGGFVPDKETALKVADAILIPIYSEDVLNDERPFTVQLKNEVWIIEGTLPEGDLGGVAVIEISKKDGCILRVSHGK